MLRPICRPVCRPIARAITGYSAGAVITGLPYPEETLTSSRAGQWYIDGLAVSGETGTTFGIPEDASPGSVVRQNGTSITILDPATAFFYAPADLMFSLSSDLIFA